MAKRNYEFKPDRARGSVLEKLLLTPRQRLVVLRWVLVAAILVVLSLLQDVILCHLDIFGATTDLVPCAIFLICMMLSVETGCVFALVSACLFQFSGSGPGYYIIAVITILCICASMFRQSFLRKDFWSCVICAAVCHMAYELTTYFVALVLGQTTLVRIGVPVVTGLMSLILLPVLYPTVRAIEKIGGEAWKD